MSINVAQADRDLTLEGNYSKAAERQAIRVAKRRYFLRGGLLGVYPPGAGHTMPIAARQIVYGKNRETPASVAEYVATLTQRIAEKKARAAAAYAANMVAHTRHVEAANA